MAACSGNHRRRLFIGEGSTFSGVESLLNKHKNTHPNLGHSITATELRTFNRTSEGCSTCEFLREEYDEETSLLSTIANLFLDQDGTLGIFCGDVCRKIESLKNRGVTVLLGLDATQLDTDPGTAGKIFKRIHWNCPHDGSNYKNQTLPPIIEKFFLSASLMQEDGDQIQITLAQPQDVFDKSPFYQGVVYNIVQAARTGGYGLKKKRSFGPERYPGYQHEQTGRSDSAPGANRQRQFIFVKGENHSQGVRVRSKLFKIERKSLTRSSYEVNTDQDSSGYSTEEEKKA